MHGKHLLCNSLFRAISGVATPTLALAIVSAVTMIATQSVQGQTFNVIYNFTGGADGERPISLTMDGAGNLYGTSSGGNNQGFCYGIGSCGIVFKLSRKASGWVLTPLYTFQGLDNGDGAYPSTTSIGSNGRLIGATRWGGTGECTYARGDIPTFVTGCGTVFSLRPPATTCESAPCPWVETLLYRFTGGSDGAYPAGNLAFDRAGNIYGTTLGGGDFSCSLGCGVVYKLTPSGWSETVIHRFGQNDMHPAGVIADNAGNIYGAGGATLNNPGTIYQLTSSESGWTETILHNFDGYDGAAPNTPMLDPGGNLYGTAEAGGSANKGGTAFMLSPANGGWTFNLLYSFLGQGGTGWGYGGPSAGPVMDAAGNLYGTTGLEGAYWQGNIFKLAGSGGGWTYSSLKDFQGGADGSWPGGLVFDANGNLYGFADGGAYGYGFIFEITP